MFGAIGGPRRKPIGGVAQMVGIAQKREEMPGEGVGCHRKPPGPTIGPYRFRVLTFFNGILSTLMLCLRSSSSPSARLSSRDPAQQLRGRLLRIATAALQALVGSGKIVHAEIAPTEIQEQEQLIHRLGGKGGKEIAQLPFLGRRRDALFVKIDERIMGMPLRQLGGVVVVHLVRESDRL
jgi:hypothetical protein